jgi:hypothetical protein
LQYCCQQKVSRWMLVSGEIREFGMAGIYSKYPRVPEDRQRWLADSL